MHLTSQLFISVQVPIKYLRIQFFYSLEVTIVVASVADFDLLILVSHSTLYLKLKASEWIKFDYNSIYRCL